MYKETIKKILRKIFRPQIVKADISVLAQNQLLFGRKAIVTGGTSGIGYQIACSFLNAGAKVLITGRSQLRIDEAIARVVNDTPDSEGRIYGLEWNLNDTDSMGVLFKKAIGILGGADILVNNAGIDGGHIINCTEERFDAIMNTNVKGSFFLSRMMGRYMISHGIQGNILNVCSSSSLRPVNSAYGLSKWAMRGLTEGLAKMLIPHGIVVNGIAPGMTATPMLNKEGSGEDLWHIDSPAGRFATPEEIANMAVILVSNMCRMVVGDILYMTGGSGLLYNEDDNYSFQ